MRISGWLMVIIVALIVLAAAGAAVLTVSWIGPVGGGPTSAGAVQVERPARNNVSAPGPIFDAGVFTVNLSGGGRTTGFLRAAISLEVDSKKAMEELEAREPAVRDTIIVALRSFTTEEVREDEGIDRLKERIQQDVSQLMTEGEVRYVYFRELITQ